MECDNKWPNITENDVKKARKDYFWSFSNEVLYDLCEKHAKHKDEKVVAAKLNIIGRTYAAALERGKREDKDTKDVFKEAAQMLTDTDIDKRITQLRRNGCIENEKDQETALCLHKQLVNIFSKAIGNSKNTKRSLASKYLHFHVPALFFLYDSNAKQGFSAICGNYRTTRQPSGHFDNEYENFFHKLLDLREYIERSFDKTLGPRELDRLLHEKARNKKN